jgi:hypothetical protein
MTIRITRPFVEKQLENLNRLTGMPLQPYIGTADGKIEPQAGNYHLDGAYNGWSFQRMSLIVGSTGAGPVAQHGYYSLKEVSNQIANYQRGWQDAKESLIPSA